MIESRSAAPLVPFSIFRLRTLTGANVVGILTGASLFSMFFFITLYLQEVLDYSAIETGLAYLPLAVTIILTAGIASQLVTRIGFKPVLAGGMVLIAVGLLWFGQISVDGSFAADVLGPSLLAAAGLGFAFVPVTIAAVSGVEPREAGLASGLINTSQQVGGALGLALLSTVAFTQINDAAAAAGGAPSPDALTDGYGDAFMVGAGIALLGFVATLVLIRGSDSRAHVELGGAIGCPDGGRRPGLDGCRRAKPRRPANSYAPTRSKHVRSSSQASFPGSFVPRAPSSPRRDICQQAQSSGSTTRRASASSPPMTPGAISSSTRARSRAALRSPTGRRSSSRRRRATRARVR